MEIEEARVELKRRAQQIVTELVGDGEMNSEVRAAIRDRIMTASNDILPNLHHVVVDFTDEEVHVNILATNEKQDNPMNEALLEFKRGIEATHPNTTVRSIHMDSKKIVVEAIMTFDIKDLIKELENEVSSD